MVDQQLINQLESQVFDDLLAALDTIDESERDDVFMIDLMRYSGSEWPFATEFTVSRNTRTRLRTYGDNLEMRWNHASVSHVTHLLSTGRGHELQESVFLGLGAEPSWLGQVSYKRDDRERHDAIAAAAHRAWLASTAAVIQRMHREQVLVQRFGWAIPVIINDVTPDEWNVVYTTIANGRAGAQGFIDYVELEHRRNNVSDALAEHLGSTGLSVAGALGIADTWFAAAVPDQSTWPAGLADDWEEPPAIDESARTAMVNASDLPSTSPAVFRARRPTGHQEGNLSDTPDIASRSLRETLVTLGAQSLVGSWQPPSLTLRKPSGLSTPADFIFTVPTVLLLRPRAIDSLGDLLRHGELLPCTTPGEEIYLYDPKLVVGGLDREASGAKTYDSSGAIMSLERVALHDGALGDAHVFKLEEWPRGHLCFSRRFVERVDECGLTGLDFYIESPL